MTYTENRTQVFDHTTTEAQAGDYFQLPYTPTVRVIAKIDLGGYVSYLVQSGSNTPEQWDVMKTEVTFGEITEITSVDSQKQKEDDAAFITAVLQQEYDWLTQPIGTNPDAIFGQMMAEQEAEFRLHCETGYHDPNWNDENTEL